MHWHISVTWRLNNVGGGGGAIELHELNYVARTLSQWNTLELGGPGLCLLLADYLRVIYTHYAAFHQAFYPLNWSKWIIFKIQWNDLYNANETILFKKTGKDILFNIINNILVTTTIIKIFSFNWVVGI